MQERFRENIQGMPALIDAARRMVRRHHDHGRMQCTIDLLYFASLAVFLLQGTMLGALCCTR
jgi:hypothetical protein